MPSYPNRCQHLKVNGTQCGSPALRRNRFCYFHKRHHDEQIVLNLDRAKQARRGRITLDLPVLEDANSIQIALMQVMRLILTGQLDAKTAGLLLYALQTASANLPRTKFEPYQHDVVLDPARVAETPLGAKIWEDSDFPDEEEEPETQEEREAAIFKRVKAKYKDLPAVADFTSPPPPPPKIPPKRLTSDLPDNDDDLEVDIEKEVHAQIEKAVPGLHAAYAAIGKRDRNGG